MSNVPPPPPGMPPPPPPGMPPPPAGGMYATGPVAPNGQPLASAGMRIAARLIEFVIAIVVGLIVAAIIIGSSGGVNGVGGDFNIGATLVSLAISWALEAGLTATKGGSIGKLILGLRVVNANDGSSPVSWGTATIRWAVPGAFSIVPVVGGLVGFVVWIVSIVFLFTDKQRQTVSDKVAKTLVVTTK